MTEIKASGNLVSLYIFVSVCISIYVHVYMNSHIYELLIVFMFTRLHLWFYNILVDNNLAPHSTNCACA